MDAPLTRPWQGHFLRVVRRANLWEHPTYQPYISPWSAQLQPLAGGGTPQDDDATEYAALLKKISPYLPGTKRDRIKVLLRGVPGLRNRVAKVSEQPDKVRHLLSQAAVKIGIDLGIASPSGPKQGTAAVRARSEDHKKNAPQQRRQSGALSDSETSKKSRQVSFEAPPQQGAAPPPANMELSLPDEWSVPPRIDFDPAQPGIYLQEDAKMISAWAAQCRNAAVAIAVISPFEHILPGLSKPKQMVINMMEKRNQSQNRIQARVWLLNISQVPVTPKQTVQPLTFGAPTAKSCVTTVDIDKTQMTSDWGQALQDRKITELKNLLELLAFGKPTGDVLDIWQITEHPQGYRLRARVHQAQLHPLFRISGQHGVYINTPIGTGNYSLAWLKPGDNQKEVTHAAALETLASITEHLGLIRKDRTTFAIRCHTDHLIKIRQALKQETADLWRLTGLPIDFQIADIDAVLKAIDWKATVQSSSRHCRKGLAMWTARAEQAPKAHRIPIQVANEHYVLSIASTRNEPKPAPTRTVGDYRGAHTWADLFKGKRTTSPAPPNATATSSATPAVRPPKRESPAADPPAPAHNAQAQAKRPRSNRSSDNEEYMTVDDEAAQSEGEAVHQLQARQATLETKMDEILAMLTRMQIPSPPA